MFAAASSSDVLGVVAVVLAFILSCLAALIAVIFNNIRRDVSQIRRDIELAERHIVSLVTIQLALRFRTASMEDHLKEKTGFTPLRDLKESVFGDE